MIIAERRPRNHLILSQYSCCYGVGDAVGVGVGVGEAVGVGVALGVGDGVGVGVLLPLIFGPKTSPVGAVSVVFEPLINVLGTGLPLVFSCSDENIEIVSFA
jgi:hypothetical protein